MRDSAMIHYDVDFYWIHIEANDTSTFVRGNTRIHARSLQELYEIVFELSGDHSVDSIYIDGIRQMDYTHENDLIRIRITPSIQKGRHFETAVYYHGEGGQDTFYSGISNRTDSRWNQKVTYTLSEPFNARDWFVCKQVLSDKADSAYIYITVPDHLKAGSNGILAGIDTLPAEKVTYRWETRYPIAYYLLSFSVSEYQDYSFYVRPGGTSDPILVQNYIYSDSAFLPAHKNEIDQTAELIKLYSELFGIYPFRKEKYGHCYAPMGGGMEHQTMTTLSDFNFTLVAHELAHQWFGNNVTCAGWQDIWINEGFASYAEYLALEYLRSEEDADIWMTAAHYWALTEPEGSVYIPEKDAKDAGRIFSRALSYKKGAALLHMIRDELGDDSIFFALLKNFQHEFKDSIASGEDFLEALDKISGRDFSWFFNQWYYGSGYPEFMFSWWQNNDTLFLHSEQTGSSPDTPVFRVNMEFRIEFASGPDSLVRLLLDRSEQSYRVAVSREVSGLSADPGNRILDRSTMIRRYVSEGNFHVIPNPFTDELTVVFKTGGRREISLCDMNGKLLKRRKSDSNQVSLNTEKLEKGFYLLKVREGKDIFTAKVIKQ